MLISLTAILILYTSLTYMFDSFGSYLRRNAGKGNFEIGGILHLYEIRNLRLDGPKPTRFCWSKFKFRISDLRCRIRPISKFRKYVDALQNCVKRLRGRNASTK